MAKFFNNTIQDILKTWRLEESTIKKLQSGKYLVEFFAPDCSRCESLAPVWSEVESAYKGNQALTILSVDCNEQNNVCSYYKIESYPSILNVENGERVEKYEGKRTLKDFKDYIEKTFLAPNAETTAITFIKDKAVFDVTPENYQDLISKDFSLIYFSLKRCTYCQELNKIYEELAERFISSRNVTIALADCGTYPDFCIKESKGCPTLTVYGNGKLLKKDYHEDHTLDGLTNLMNAYAVGGELLESWLKGESVKRLARKERERKADQAKSGK